MAYPLNEGMNFKVEYIEREAGYCMRTTDIYTDYYGIGYIVSGDRQIATPEHTFFVHKGYLSPINMNLYHHTASISANAYSRYGIRFTPAVAQRIITHLGEAQFEQIMSHVSYQLDEAAQAQTLKLYQEMLYEYEHYDAHSEFLLQGLLEQLIILILRKGQITESAEIKINVYDMLILKILSYIDVHYAQNPSVKELALIAGLSESHFMKRFRQSVGSTYKTYLNLYKIQIASGLLINTSCSLQRISDELGFCNSNYFSSTFKKYMKISPLEYRRTHQQHFRYTE